MKIEAAVHVIADAATFAARHTPRVPALPAFAGLILAADPVGALTLTGYDVEAGSTVTVPALVGEPGRALVPGRALSEILRTLPDAEASVAIEAAAVRIAVADIEFVLPTLDLDDAPQLPAPPAPLGTVDGARLKEAVEQVASVTARDVTPPVLSAVRVDLERDRLVLAATDRYRVARRELPWSGPDQEVRALVPGHQLTALTTALDPARPWAIGADPIHFGASDGARSSWLRLLDGAYPPVENLIPTGLPSRIEVNRPALTEAVRRVRLAEDDRSRGAVVFRCGPGQLELRGGQGTHTGRQRLAADLSGPAVHSAFTVSYLLQALESMTGERTVIRLGPGVGKVLITDPQEPAYQHVLMSRRLPG